MTREEKIDSALVGVMRLHRDEAGVPDMEYWCSMVRITVPDATRDEIRAAINKCIREGFRGNGMKQ